jgi:large subunit ribosomal protein L23
MDVYHTIIRPLVTEKTTHQANRQREGRGGAYSFEVRHDANKAEIRDAIEKVYGVKVVSVRTSVRPGKPRRHRMHIGRTAETKKAVVVLAPGAHINLF